MELLTFSLGDARVSVAARQVRRVEDWPTLSEVPVAELGHAAGIAVAPFDAGRLLTCSDPVRMGFIIPAVPLRQSEVAPESLFQLPAALRRLRPPPWLAGVVRGRWDFREDELSLLIDLHLLSIAAVALGPTPDPAAPHRGP